MAMQHANGKLQTTPRGLVKLAGAVLTRTGARLARGLTKEAWNRDWQKIAVWAQANHWWLADYLHYFMYNFGDPDWDLMHSMTGYGKKYLKILAWTGSKFAVSERHPGLSVAYHMQMAFMEPQARKRLMDKVASEQWSVGKLITYLKNRRKVKTCNEHVYACLRCHARLPEVPAELERVRRVRALAENPALAPVGRTETAGMSRKEALEHREAVQLRIQKLLSKGPMRGRDLRLAMGLRKSVLSGPLTNLRQARKIIRKGWARGVTWQLGPRGAVV